MIPEHEKGPEYKAAKKESDEELEDISASEGENIHEWALGQSSNNDKQSQI